MRTRMQEVCLGFWEQQVAFLVCTVHYKEHYGLCAGSVRGVALSPTMSDRKHSLIFTWTD